MFVVITIIIVIDFDGIITTRMSTSLGNDKKNM